MTPFHSYSQTFFFFEKELFPNLKPHKHLVPKYIYIYIYFFFLILLIKRLSLNFQDKNRFKQILFLKRQKIGRLVKQLTCLTQPSLEHSSTQKVKIFNTTSRWKINRILRKKNWIRKKEEKNNINRRTIERIKKEKKKKRVRSGGWDGVMA